MARRARGSTPEMVPPSLVIVGSPGMTRMRQKMMIELSQSRPMLVSTLLATYAVIAVHASPGPLRGLLRRAFRVRRCAACRRRPQGARVSRAPFSAGGSHAHDYFAAPFEFVK